jgi:hypothetical protein
MPSAVTKCAPARDVAGDAAEYRAAKQSRRLPKCLTGKAIRLKQRALAIAAAPVAIVAHRKLKPEPAGQPDVRAKPQQVWPVNALDTPPAMLGADRFKNLPERFGIGV